MMIDPSLRISACSRPTALPVQSSARNELEQTSSARRSVWWASVPRTGRISCSTTGMPAWSVIYAASMVAIGQVMLRSLGAEALQIARKGRFSPEDAEVIASKLANSIPAFLLVLLLAVTLISIITAGIYRLVLRPGEKGFVHLRLGADELRLTLVNLLLFGIGLV